MGLRDIPDRPQLGEGGFGSLTASSGSPWKNLRSGSSRYWRQSRHFGGVVCKERGGRGSFAQSYSWNYPGFWENLGVSHQKQLELFGFGKMNGLGIFPEDNPSFGIINSSQKKN